MVLLLGCITMVSGTVNFIHGIVERSVFISKFCNESMSEAIMRARVENNIM